MNKAPELPQVSSDDKKTGLKRSRKMPASEITDKAKSLLDRLAVFEEQLNDVKANIHVDASSVEEKMLVAKNSLEGTLRSSEQRSFKTKDLDKTFEELEKLGKDIESLESDLNATLYQYQIYINTEFSNRIGKLRDVGVEVKSTINSSYNKSTPLDVRIKAIKQIQDGGKALAEELLRAAEPIYEIVRTLYNPSLPEKSKAIENAKQKLEKNEPTWIAIEALYSSLNNWARQYGDEILGSVRYLEKSLKPIADLSVESDVLPRVFGDSMPKVLDYAQKVEAMTPIVKKTAEKDHLTLPDVLALKDDIQSFLGIAKDVISFLYAELIRGEDSIERLLPTKDFLWVETNSTLNARLKKATETLSTPSRYMANEVMENLPAYMSYINEAVQAIALNDERKEFLLNYPTAEAAIQEQLKQKKRISAQDLPFQPAFASEYLRLYYTQRFSEFAFDRENLWLIQRS